ncbi:MAG: ATP-binding protein [Trichlorobacter sp.]|jgi:nitrogen-specific signal transduction histidine kinase|nr:ATP-binding protein [Trichlorobacter sp.]
MQTETINIEPMPETYFAPAGRADVIILDKERKAIAQAAFIEALMQAMPDFVMVLNEHRQIVAINQRVLAALGLDSVTDLIGKRPGEAFGCIHACDGPDGCGTGKNCAVCGAVLAILESQETGTQAVGECRIVVCKDGGTALDLEAVATPLSVAGMPMTVFALRDISSDKRRQVLERVFFHDIINTAGGIRGVASLLLDDTSLPEEQQSTYKSWLVNLSDDLIDEIKHHQRLLAAERGEYLVQKQETELADLLTNVFRVYEHHSKTPGRKLVLEPVPPCKMLTDQPILRRIAGNMVLNALEATPSGGTVHMRAVVSEKTVRIEVENSGEIPSDVQRSIFKRSFSTKANSGRGIGTYSMKLFGERYLGGKVGFTSKGNQTVFYIELNR